MGLVDVIDPITVSEETFRVWVNVEGREACTAPMIAALVEVIVPVTARLETETAPFTVRVPRNASPATTALVDVIEPTTVRDAMLTLWENVDGSTAITAPTMAELVDVIVPTEVMLLKVTTPAFWGENAVYWTDPSGKWSGTPRAIEAPFTSNSLTDPVETMNCGPAVPSGSQRCIRDCGICVPMPTLPPLTMKPLVTVAEPRMSRFPSESILPTVTSLESLT